MFLITLFPMNIATLLPVSGHPLFTATHWCFYVITPFVDREPMRWLVKSLFFMLISTRFMLTSPHQN
jgi:hypothetical protein